MEIKKPAVAGTIESSDCMIEIEANDTNTIEINLTSTVKEEFGDEILSVVKKTLERLGVKSATLEITDKGALNCVIEARVEAAVYRAAETKEFDWRNY